MSRAALDCKANYAVIVKITAPCRRADVARKWLVKGHECLIIAVLLRMKKLDNLSCKDIIMFTVLLLGDAHAKTAARRRQTAQPARAGRHQSTLPSCDRRLVCRQRVL